VRYSLYDIPAVRFAVSDADARKAGPCIGAIGKFCYEPLSAVADVDVLQVWRSLHDCALRYGSLRFASCGKAEGIPSKARVFRFLP